jgi:DNA-binding LytR/AlgR family response regulator
MIRAIAIDDEPLALQVIETFCEKLPQLKLEKTFNSPKEGLHYCHAFPVSLLFLDIQMPGLTGLELIKKLPRPMAVVFTTAYEQYALDGFNLDAVDYLLKPFAFERFVKAVEKVELHLINKKEQLATQESGTIFIRADYSLVKIETTTILYIEGLDDYIKIHLEVGKPIVARYTMKNILQQLSPLYFVRIHRSYIVPVKRIRQIKSKSVVIESIEIPIGNSYEDQLNFLKSV